MKIENLIDTTIGLISDAGINFDRPFEICGNQYRIIDNKSLEKLSPNGWISQNIIVECIQILIHVVQMLPIFSGIPNSNTAQRMILTCGIIMNATTVIKDPDMKCIYMFHRDVKIPTYQNSIIIYDINAISITKNTTTGIYDVDDKLTHEIDLVTIPDKSILVIRLLYKLGFRYASHTNIDGNDIYVFTRTKIRVLARDFVITIPNSFIDITIPDGYTALINLI